MFDLKKLAAEFPKEQISWRAQHCTKDGTKALALAYIDSRDVMNRLDEVCGEDGWQCKYPIANGKTICEIGIRCRVEFIMEEGKPQTAFCTNPGEWIWKADGAGDTDIEAEKGAISDAFKRAAVKWGIGRYLYNMEGVWVPCKSYLNDKNGKYTWQEFIDDPWNFVKKRNYKSIFGNAAAMRAFCDNVTESFSAVQTPEELKTLASLNKAKFDEMDRSENEHDRLAVDELRKRYAAAMTRVRSDEANAANFSQGFNEAIGRKQ